MILDKLTALADALAQATDLPAYPVEGVEPAQGRAVRLFPPLIKWDHGLTARDVWALAHWTVPATITCAGTSSAQLRQLYDDVEAVLAALPDPWRVTAMTPGIATDASGGTPIYTLTLEA